MDREVFSRYHTGIDLRNKEDDTEQNSFRDLLNCYVSVNNRIEKRGGFKEVEVLDANSEGLFPFNNLLWTFQANSGTSIVAQAIPEVWTIILGHSGTITRVHYVGVLLGGLYCSIEFDEVDIDGNPVIAHYYLVTNISEWEADKEYNNDPKGIRVVPAGSSDPVAKTINLDYFYEAAELGNASGGTVEPLWPIVAGDPITENEIIWNTVTIKDRSSDNQSYAFNPDGVYCTPTANATVIFKATNIRDGESKESGVFADVIWPTIAGDTVVDGGVVWEAVACSPWASGKSYEIDHPLDEENPELNTLAHTLTEAAHANYRDFVYVGKRGTVKGGATAPTWPTVIGETVSDGNITWVTKSTRVIDKNCPNTAEVLVIESKVYAIGSNIESKHETDIVRYSATNAPFDWSSEQDAGFLPTGTQSAGSEIARALGRYSNKLVVIMDDNIQIWSVDPDPARNALTQVIDNLGTNYSDTVLAIGTDMIFLTPYGFRSLGQREASTDFEDTDIGSSVDDPVVAMLENFTGQPVATLYSTRSQYWCSIGNDIWTWTYSRNNEVKAWARYVSPNPVKYFAQSGNQLFIRTDDNRLILVDESNKVDYDGDYLMGVDFQFQSCKAVGILKQFSAFDALITGSASVTFGQDSNNPTAETMPVTIKNNTRPGQLLPIHVMSTELAPRIRYTGGDDLRIDSFSVYFEPLGLV